MYAVINALVWCFVIACGILALVGLIAAIAVYWEKIILGGLALGAIGLFVWAWFKGPDEFLVLLGTPILIAIVFAIPLAVLRLRNGAWTLDEQIKVRIAKERRAKGYES